VEWATDIRPVPRTDTFGDLRRGSITSTSGNETFPSPAALRKAQQQVTEFHRFQELCAAIIAVSERICALRPVEAALTP
jgi:hypothetical protein